MCAGVQVPSCGRGEVVEIRKERDRAPGCEIDRRDRGELRMGSEGEKDSEKMHGERKEGGSIGERIRLLRKEWI